MQDDDQSRSTPTSTGAHHAALRERSELMARTYYGHCGVRHYSRGRAQRCQDCQTTPNVRGFFGCVLLLALSSYILWDTFLKYHWVATLIGVLVVSTAVLAVKHSSKRVES